MCGLFEFQIDESSDKKKEKERSSYLHNMRYGTDPNFLESEIAGIGWSRDKEKADAYQREKNGKWEELIEKRRQLEEEAKQEMVLRQQRVMLESMNKLIAKEEWEEGIKNKEKKAEVLEVQEEEKEKEDANCEIIEVKKEKRSDRRSSIVNTTRRKSIID